MNFIKYKEEVYILDLNAILNWCSLLPSNQLKEIEINEGYDANEEGDLTIMTKIVRETKTNNTQSETIKYDLFKFIITPLLEVKNIEPDNFSQILILNTLIDMKFLIKQD